MTFNNFNEPGRVEVDVTWDFSGCDSDENVYAVEADYKPGRPAPRCSDPDAAAFSDPGDPAEWTIVSVKERVTGREVSPTLWKDDSGFDEEVGEALLEDLEQHRRERSYARVGYP